MDVSLKQPLNTTWLVLCQKGDHASAKTALLNYKVIFLRQGTWDILKKKQNSAMNQFLKQY